MNTLTIIGGGIGGLIAAIAAAEAGLEVRLREAKEHLGGVATTTTTTATTGGKGGDFRANIGPHVLYDDGPLWQWLDERGLTDGAHYVPKTAPIYFRIDGKRHRSPGIGMIRALRTIRRTVAPPEASFREWATELVGLTHARHLANFAGVTTFDHDPGRFAASFVQERICRASKFPPSARYIPGGWGTLVERLVARAMELGVVVTVGDPVVQLPDSPVVLAIPIRAARRLIGGVDLVEHGTTVACLDLGVRGRRPPFIISDLDASGWIETFSRPDPSLAPRDQHLIQAQAGLLPDGETLEEAITRIERLLDIADTTWRTREVWRRRSLQINRSGAVDLPGRTWRDRANIDRGDGVMLVNDQVAAPGLLSEVTHAAAIQAVNELQPRRTGATRP